MLIFIGNPDIDNISPTRICFADKIKQITA